MSAAALKPEPTAASRMVAAAALLREATERLDREEHQCDKCGRTSHHNWTHAQVAKQLGAMVHKLGRLAEELTTKGEDV